MPLLGVFEVNSIIIFERCSALVPIDGCEVVKSLDKRGRLLNLFFKDVRQVFSIERVDVRFNDAYHAQYCSLPSYFSG